MEAFLFVGPFFLVFLPRRLVGVALSDDCGGVASIDLGRDGGPEPVLMMAMLQSLRTTIGLDLGFFCIFTPRIRFSCCHS